MAWTAPRTWAVGEVVTAALMNTHVRDNLLYLKSALDTIAAGDYPETLSNQIPATPPSNSGTAETTLFSYTLPADTLDVNGRKVRVMVSGTTSADSDNKVFRLYLGGTGGTKLWDSGNTTINNEWWTLEAEINRDGVGSQYSTVTALWARGGPGADLQALERTASSEDETGALDIVVTGQSSVGSDRIYGYQMLVERAA